MTSPSPGQNPTLITSCEYASLVMESASGRTGARRPEKRVGAYKYLPEAMRVFRIIRLVALIQRETHRPRNFHRHGPDFDVDAERFQCAHKFSIKFGDRTRLQAKRANLAATRRNF